MGITMQTFSPWRSIVHMKSDRSSCVKTEKNRASERGSNPCFLSCAHLACPCPKRAWLWGCRFQNVTNLKGVKGRWFQPLVEDPAPRLKSIAALRSDRQHSGSSSPFITVPFCTWLCALGYCGVETGKASPNRSQTVCHILKCKECMCALTVPLMRTWHEVNFEA